MNATRQLLSVAPPRSAGAGALFSVAEHQPTNRPRYQSAFQAFRGRKTGKAGLTPSGVDSIAPLLGVVSRLRRRRDLIDLDVEDFQRLTHGALHLD